MHNVILSTFVKKKILFFILKLIIFISVSFLEIQSSEIIVIKGAFVNRTCQFIVGRSIKTTSTVPFINLVKLFVLLNEIMNSNTHLQHFYKPKLNFMEIKVVQKTKELITHF